MSSRPYTILAELDATQAELFARLARQRSGPAAPRQPAPSTTDPRPADASPPAGLSPHTPGVTSLAVVKAADEARYTLGLSYFADTPDAHGEYVRAARLEKTAWNYLARHRQIGLYHADGTEGSGTVVESYIYRGPDWTVGDTIIKAGDWLMGVVWDEPAWKLVKSGLVNGLSMQGRAIRRGPA